ncbi:hypothetical protein ABE073_04645 [Lederbergia citrisecunda]|uniref:hypothetical protein n=1 Tax=Lederbergia citrisecunda TaxID=2833583 RepID=UPI003D2E7CC4
MTNFKAPEKKHVYVNYNVGRYNLLSSKDVAQYSFRFPHLSQEEIKELGIRTFYNLELEEDYGFTGDALDVAYEIKQIIDGYWMNSSKGDIEKLVEYLESIEEDQAELREQYEIDYAKAKVDYWTEKYEKLTR